MLPSNTPSILMMAMRKLDVLATASCAGWRLASSAAQVSSVTSNQAEEDLPKPTYTYSSPGSSMMDPTYNTGHSLGTPSYIEYDPKPRASVQDPLPNLSFSGQKPQSANASFGQQSSKAPTSASTNAAIDAAQKAASGEGQAAQAPQPTYTYASPGSSMREASYGFSVRDPVYFVDPGPGEDTAAASSGSQPRSSTAGTKQQPVAQQPPQGKVRIGLKDDYANTSYVTSPNHSMEEPHYVSISDPLDKKPRRK